MTPKELDVIKLKDGREGAVLEVFDGGAAYMVELADGQGQTIGTPIIKKDEIAEITYSY